jgi:hypothetical protein
MNHHFGYGLYPIYNTTINIQPRTFPHTKSAIKNPLYCSRTERGKETPTSQ